MKKIISLFIFTLFIVFAVGVCFMPSKDTSNAVNVGIVYAEELTTEETESAETPTTGEETTEEETPTEDTNAPTTEEEKPVYTFTEEELINLINTALTEQQKEIVNGLAGKIASAFGIDHNTVYLVIGGALAITLLIIVLFAKIFKSKGSLKALNTQLKAQQSAYVVLSEAKDDLTKALSNLTATEIGEVIKKAYSENTEELINKVSDAVIAKLKIDDNTLSELIGAEKLVVAQNTALKEALIAIALGNRDLAVKRLSEAPTEETVNALALENEKLKTALGEKAVAETLGTKTTATETETDKKGA